MAQTRASTKTDPAWPSIVFLLQRHDFTSADLAEAAAVHEHTVHRVLLRLEVEGLAVRVVPDKRTGSGRVADVWRWNREA